MRSFDQKSHIAMSAYRLLCTSVDSPYSRKALALLNDGKYHDLANMDIKPSEYDNPLAFSQDYAVYSYLRKYEGFPLDQQVLEKKARLDFEKIEDNCRIVNSALRLPLPQKGGHDIIYVANRKIRKILGAFTYGKVIAGCEWGNGATSTLKRADATIDKKILEPRLSVTRRALRYASAYLEQDLHWLRARLGPDVEGPACLLPGEFKIVEDGRFATVPKTVKSLRSIDIQPTLNLFLQKGVGLFIRKQLQKNGIDLDDQSRNQRLAACAYTDMLSTIDLASASDTVTHELVKQLLPVEWYDYLNDIRTHSISIDGTSKKLEKFSAMGNGFTFELESLIFYALCDAVRTVRDEPASVVSVYGDDIVVSRTLSEDVVSALTYCGFTVNVDKTFIDGPFYESCGKHYFQGIEVTPVFQKEVLRDNPSTIRATNRIIRLASTCNGGAFLDYRYKEIYDFYRTFIRTKVSVLGPLWLEGDGFVKDPYYRPKADIHGVFQINEFRNVQDQRKLADHSPLLAITLRRGVIVKNPFYGCVAIVGRTRSLLCRRRVSVEHAEVPVWASYIALKAM